jgi:hypothetical protein
MICKRCRSCADRGLVGADHLLPLIEDGKTVEEACPGGTWCTCQHRDDDLQTEQ